jgi:RNA polymerase-binding transcription factor DksA
MSQTNSITPTANDAIAARLIARLERGERQLVGLESNLTGALRDRGTILEDREGQRALVDAVRADVAQARRALSRLADGTYGHCSACGTTIPPERLEAIPTTDRCARCA